MLVKTQAGKLARYLYADQKSAPERKALIRMINADYTPRKDDFGREIVKFCDPATLTVIGYIN
ncbi:hypothetical protein GCM10027347_52410 [Larkinella harenae]